MDKPVIKVPIIKACGEFYSLWYEEKPGKLTEICRVCREKGETEKEWRMRAMALAKLIEDNAP